MLYVNNENEPTSFDPPIGFNNVSWQPLNNIMEGLTRLGKDHEPSRQWRRNGLFRKIIKLTHLRFGKMRNGQTEIL